VGPRDGRDLEKRGKYPTLSRIRNPDGRARLKSRPPTTKYNINKKFTMM